MCCLSVSERIIADRQARERADLTAFDVALKDPCNASSEKWKAEQRDWLLATLRALCDMWLAESEKKESYYFPDNPEADRIAKGRTGGCARQLNFILGKIL